MVIDASPVFRRPDREPSFADYILPRQRPTGTRIFAVNAVVSHNEIFVYRDFFSFELSNCLSGDIRFIQREYGTICFIYVDYPVFDLDSFTG